MNPGCGWIAPYDQFQASADESLQKLLKIAQGRSEGQTEAFRAVWSAAQTLPPDAQSGIVAAAIVHILWETHP